jgi:hypothetical protein
MISFAQIGLCHEKARLIGEIADAIKLMISYHNTELERVIAGQPSSFNQESYNEARKSKEILEAALRAHRRLHGC